MGKGSKTPDRVIQIVIAKDESMELKDRGTSQKLSQREVASAVKKAQGDETGTPVVISADRNVKYESVVKVMDTLQKSGVQRVGLSVQLGSK